MRSMENRWRWNRLVCLGSLVFFGWIELISAQPEGWSLKGLSVTPHRRSEVMRWRRPGATELGARVEMFWVNRSSEPLRWKDSPIRWDGDAAETLLNSGTWAWHDTPDSRPGAALAVASGEMNVWAFNTNVDAWGVGTEHRVEWGDSSYRVSLEAPKLWLSALTFLGDDASIEPTRIVAHVANESGAAARVAGCRLWLPDSGDGFRALKPTAWRSEGLVGFGGRLDIPPGDRGGFQLAWGPMPLSYTAVEVEVEQEGERFSLWAHLRIKKEVFDISGGWIASANALQHVPILKTYHRMHINTGHFEEVHGYTNNPELYNRYPLKRFAKLEDLTRYDADARLPEIHAVEFLGEPQYGGGTPVPPQQVWQAFIPYHGSRLPTSVTHSEERIWREYAGLSDYPHYDAYRVTAPAADSWGQYDRWDGERIRWGAPLETIGALTESLRELNRPKPIAYWSQGAHNWHSWSRDRGSPTPEELRAQAYHALGARITSLYWFNLSLDSLTRYRDLIEPINRVNREVRVMSPLLLSGDAYERRRDGEWELSSVTGPDGGLFFIHDVAYKPVNRRFKFTEREAKVYFKLPPYLRTPAEVFRFDADGVHEVAFAIEDSRLIVESPVFVASMFVAAPRSGTRDRWERRWNEVLRHEASFDFDPASNAEDFETLRRLKVALEP